MAKRKPRDPIVIAKDNEGRMKALDNTLKDLTKRFGDGTIQRLGDATNLKIDVIPSGSLGLDIAIGVGGIPRGRITEIYGPESSGKTTFCLHVVAEAQKRGGICAFVDMEHALDPRYAEVIGVQVDTLYISQPDTGEQALEITESLVRSGALDVIVVDSVAALVPRAEIEGEMGDSHVGLQARLMSQALRKLSGAVKQSNVTLMFTNQIREKIGVMFGCFDYDSPVLLADGTTLPIGEIVENKLDVEVLSYNDITRIFEPRRIANWFNNGKTENFLEIKVANQAKDSSRKLICTPNHLILTPDGYIPAGELEVGQAVMAMIEQEMMVAAGGASVATMPYVPVEEIIESIATASTLPNMYRFDIEVEGNHCYLVDGVVVHNSPETTSGGRALKFYASVRLDIRRIQSIKSGNENVGNRTRIKIKKNKVAPPFREAEFDIMFNEGISKTGEIIDIATEMGLIEKRGAFYRYQDGLIGQGREKAKIYLMENPEVSFELENLIREEYGLSSLGDAEKE